MVVGGGCSRCGGWCGRHLAAPGGGGHKRGRRAENSFPIDPPAGSLSRPIWRRRAGSRGGSLYAYHIIITTSRSLLTSLRSHNIYIFYAFYPEYCTLVLSTPSRRTLLSSNKLVCILYSSLVLRVCIVPTKYSGSTTYLYMLREYVLYELFIRASIIINLASRIFIMLLIILCILSIFAGYHDMALAHIHLESFSLPFPPSSAAPASGSGSSTSSRLVSSSSPPSSHSAAV